MNINLIKQLRDILFLGNNKGISIDFTNENILKFSEGAPKTTEQKKVAEEFDRLTAKEASAAGMTRREFLRTPMALTAAAFAISILGSSVVFSKEALAADISNPANNQPNYLPPPFQLPIAFGSPVMPLQNFVPEVNVEGKTAVVIGGSRGIGKGVAIALAGIGMRVIATSRIPSNYTAVPGVELWQLELASNGSLKSFINKIKHQVGTIDLLVLNAGRLFFGDMLTSSEESRLLLMQTNVWGHMTLLKELVPLMPSGDNDYARVIATSSVAERGYYFKFPLDQNNPNGPSIFVNPYLAEYSTTKAALTHMVLGYLGQQDNRQTGILDAILGPGAGAGRKNLKVSAVHPTLANTDGPKNSILGDPNNPILQFLRNAAQNLNDTQQGVDTSVIGVAYAQLAQMANPYTAPYIFDPNPSNPAAIGVQLGLLIGVVFTDNMTLRTFPFP